MTFKHIIWDWNGTIFNDIQLCVELINSVLKKRDLPQLTIEQYRNIFTFPVRDYYAKAGLDLEKYPFEELGKEWMDEYQKRRWEVKLFDQALRLLKKIYQYNIEQSILSAYKQDTLFELIDHFNLRKYFTHLIGLDHIYATSKLELGKELMDKIKYRKHEVLLIGDTVHDAEVAEEIGADCVLVAEGHQSKEKLKSCGVIVFDTLNDLVQNSQITFEGFFIKNYDRVKK